jgi:hypothetical protein
MAHVEPDAVLPVAMMARWILEHDPTASATGEATRSTGLDGRGVPVERRGGLHRAIEVES